MPCVPPLEYQTKKSGFQMPYGHMTMRTIQNPDPKQRPVFERAGIRMVTVHVWRHLRVFPDLTFRFTPSSKAMTNGNCWFLKTWLNPPMQEKEFSNHPKLKILGREMLCSSTQVEPQDPPKGLFLPMTSSMHKLTVYWMLGSIPARCFLIWYLWKI